MSIQVLRNIRQCVDAWEIRWYHHVFIFVIAFVLIVSRRPDVILHAQFWAEDGRVWFQQAYNSGFFEALLTPHTGYFQTFSRISAGVAQLVPLVFAPLVFNLLAIVIKILPIHLLFSKRFSKLIPSVSTQLLISLLYIGLPNTTEVFVNVTNTHWYLALIAFMIIVAEVSKTIWGKIGDVVLLALSGLSGPFVILLFPVALVRWLVKKDRAFLWSFVIIVLCAVIQGYFIVQTAVDTRSSMTLGASVGWFVKIVSGQIMIAALVGKKGFEYLYRHGALTNLVYTLVFLFGLIPVAYTMLKARWEAKMFVVFGTLVLIVSLAKPMVSLTEPQWPIMSIPGAATRYWFIPIVAFVGSVLVMAHLVRKRYLKILLTISVTVMLGVGVLWDWRHAPWEDLQYRSHIQQFEQAHSGEVFHVPIHPKGWNMSLIRR